MELAKVTAKGQVTIPIEIRKKLGIKNGDKILFVEESGRIYMMNSSMDALREAQRAFAGEAERPLGSDVPQNRLYAPAPLQKWCYRRRRHQNSGRHSPHRLQVPHGKFPKNLSSHHSVRKDSGPFELH